MKNIVVIGLVLFGLWCLAWRFIPMQISMLSVPWLFIIAGCVGWLVNRWLK